MVITGVAVREDIYEVRINLVFVIRLRIRKERL